MLRPAERSFLQSALGEEGYSALHRAVLREPRLAGALIPRVVVGWLKFATAREYEGSIPGVNDSYVHFTKSDSTFSGALTFADGVYDFNKSSLYHLATAISLSIGHEPQELDPLVREITLKRLGSSIDTLIKAQVVSQHLAKARLGPLTVATFGTLVVEKTPEDLYLLVDRSSGKILGEGFESLKAAVKAAKATRTQKAEGHGPAAAPGKQNAPVAPVLPAKQTKNTLAVAKSQADRQCHVCGGYNFVEDSFRGCLCFRDLAPDTKVKKTENGFELTFRKSADADAVWLLTRSLRRSE